MHHRALSRSEAGKKSPDLEASIRRRGAYRFRGFLQGGPTPPASGTLETCVQDDAPDPGGEAVPSPELGELLPRGHQAFLHRVFRFHLSHHGAGQPNQRAPVELNQLREGATVSTAGKLHELFDGLDVFHTR